MKNKVITYRASSSNFHSIENVFNALTPFLDLKKVELPFHSKGLKKRIKNILFLKNQKAGLIHISGHDHYLLWYPFKNVILTIHDIEIYRRNKGLKKWVLKKLWFDWPIKNARVITTISNFSKKEIQSIGNYKTPIQVIYNPLTLPLKKSLKIFNQDHPRILHLGCKKNKNLLRLIEALDSISCELIIIGNENKDQRDALKKFGINYQIKNGLSSQEVIQEYEKCDLVAFVSTYEGFGLPIIEAQALGRPVITSSVASMPEIANDGALFVNPFSINEIRDGILEIINNNELRNQLIINGFNNVKRFDTNEIANQYTNLYQKINDN